MKMQSEGLRPLPESVRNVKCKFKQNITKITGLINVAYPSP